LNINDVFNLKPTEVWENIKDEYIIKENKQPPPPEEGNKRSVN
jgi:hypothetical protein